MSKKTLRRLSSMLKDEPPRTEEKARWSDLEVNPFEVSEQRPDPPIRRSPTEDGAGLTTFRQENTVDTPEPPQAATPEESQEETSVKETNAVTAIPASDVDEVAKAGHRAAVVAFQAAVSEAQREAEAQLKSLVDRVRKEEADRHAAEVTRVREELERQHAEDLQQARSAVVDSFNALTGSMLGGG